MKVPNPINPETPVSYSQRSYVKNVEQPNFDILAQAARSFSQHLEEEDKKKEEFKISQAVIDESNALLVDFDQKTKEAPLGAPKFSEDTNTAYTKRHQELLQVYREQGFSREALNALDLKFSALRQGMLVKSMAFQTQSNKALSGKQIEDLGVGVSQHVGANPNTLPSGLDELQHAINSLPNLNAEDKLKLYEEQARLARSSAAHGLAIQDPDTVIRLLDPEKFVKENVEPGPTVVAKTVKPSGALSDEIVSGLQARGLTPAQARGVAAGIAAESANDPKAFNSAGGGQGAAGLGQWRGDRQRRLIARYGPNPTRDEQLDFLVEELRGGDAGGPKVLSKADEASVLYSYVHDFMRPGSEGARGDMRRGLAALGLKLEGKLPLTEVKPAPGTRKMTEEEVAKVAEQPPEYNKNGKTGHPVLDLLNGDERMQVLAWARQETHKKDAEVKASLLVQHENAVNAYLTTGQYAGELPDEAEYISVFGETVGKQKYAEVIAAGKTGQAVQHFKTESNANILAEVEASRPKDTASPTYAVELQAFQRMQQAAQQVIDARKKDPASYLFSTYPNLGTQLQAAKTPEARKRAYASINEAFKQMGTPASGRKIMTTEAAEQLQQQYANMTPAQKLASLETWHSELGDLRSAFLNQLNEDGHGAGFDYFLRYTLSDQPNYRSTLSQIFAGQQIIKEDPARKPSAELINTNFKNSIGDAMMSLNPAASRIFNDAAAAIYVANGGRTDSNMFDVDKYSAAVRQALGGVAEDNTTGFVQMGKGRVKDWTILPPGVKQQELENFIDRLLPGSLEAISAEKLPPIYATGQRVKLEDVIDEGVLVMVSPNHYMIKMSSDGKPLKTATGSNFIIRLNVGMVKSLQNKPTFEQWQKANERLGSGW